MILYLQIALFIMLIMVISNQHDSKRREEDTMSSLDDLQVEVNELHKDINRIIAIVESGKDAETKIAEIRAVVKTADDAIEATAPEPPAPPEG